MKRIETERQADLVPWLHLRVTPRYSVFCWVLARLSSVPWGGGDANQNEIDAIIKPGLAANITSVSQAAVQRCRENGIAVIPGSCPNQFLQPDFGHRLMRVLWRTLGFLKLSQHGTVKAGIH